VCTIINGIAQSERVVQEALDRLVKGRTVLVIAHRLSTIERADCIVVLGRGGNVLEQGTHTSLMDHQGPYHKLYRRMHEES
jgi:ABC-type multidrug transport system fused ATPase/permease subunit